MSKISGPTASIAVVAVLVVSGIGAGVPVASAAGAANCAAAPTAGAPQGQHWYYHFDRTTHRKCWYLHATVALAHHAADEPAAADAESAGAAPAAPQPSATAAHPANPDPPAETDAAVPPSASDADSAQPGPDAAPATPRVTVLTVKTVPEPFVDTTARSPQRPPDNVAAPPTPQTLPQDANTADNGVNAPETAGLAAAPAAPVAAPQDSAPTVDTASAAARKKSGEMFLLLALALGIAAGVVAIVSKMIGPYRTPRFADDPDAAWIRYRAAQQHYDDEAAYDEQDVPFLEPQPEHGLADPAPAEQPSEKDIELALRILQQARQSRVA